jgi:ribonucleotide reductase alpha subunit
MKTRKIDIVLNGKVVKSDFEVPEHFSDRAATIMATKYATDTENSALQIIDRVVNQIKHWGIQQKYFSTLGQETIDFATDLTDILVNQRAAFNSPVNFNCGVKENHPQMSACFIIPVEDTMEDILAHNTREGLIFRSGSGSGTNVSKLRAKGEKLSNKGEASGPISFMKTWDVSAGSIKSGGRNRRSAKLICMDVDHPDIKDFITCKKLEEDKARILVAGGVDLEEAKSTICFQNTNHSIRVNDEFMEAVEENGSWTTINRGDKCKNRTWPAKDLLWKAAEMTWHCGDPGIQYHDRINQDNPVPSMGIISCSNPCFSGDMRLLTACGFITFKNLAHYCLSTGSKVPILNKDGQISFSKIWSNGVKSTICVCFTEAIPPIQCTEDHLFMLDNGQSCKASLLVGKKLLSGLHVCHIAPSNETEVFDFSEPLSHWGLVSSDGISGIVVHNCSEYMAVDNSSCNLASMNLVKYSDKHGKWDAAQFRRDIHTMITAMDILIEAAEYPTPEVRAVTVATRPLGLGFTNLGALLMQRGVPYDSDKGRLIASNITEQMTEFAYEKSIELADRLGSYPAHEKDRLDAKEICIRLTGKPHLGQEMWEKGLRNSQLTLLAPTGTISFMMDCETTGIEPFLFEESTKKCVDGSVMKILSPAIEEAKKKYGDSIPKLYQTAYGKDGLSWKAHLDMMLACQKHLNGAISKTVGMPNSATVADIFDCYVYAWEIGLKAVAVYRDGSKIDQPLNSTDKKELAPVPTIVETVEEEPQWRALRRRLKDTRYGPNHKFDIAGFEGYLNTGTYPEGNLGEIFVIASKSGSSMQGLLNVFATAVSIGLQYGVPLEKYVEKFINTKFDPSGFTHNPDIRMCSSVVDYIFRWLAQEFLESENDTHEEATQLQPKVNNQIQKQENATFDGPNCHNCGGITQRAGSCYICTTCATTNGCS